jgi:hypothetical protein
VRYKLDHGEKSLAFYRGSEEGAEMSDIAQLNERIDAAKKELYALYAERREMKAAAKPKRITRKSLGADAVALIQQGWTRDQIAEHYNVRPSTVRTWINDDISDRAYAEAEARIGPGPGHNETGWDDDIAWTNRWLAEAAIIQKELRAALKWPQCGR